jgi:hypothetical protein
MVKFLSSSLPAGLRDTSLTGGEGTGSTKAEQKGNKGSKWRHRSDTNANGDETLASTIASELKQRIDDCIGYRPSATTNEFAYIRHSVLN